MKNKKTSDNNTTPSVEGLSPLVILKTINEFLSGSQLSEEALNQASPYADCLAKQLNLTRDEVIILAAIIETSLDRDTSGRDLACFFHCPNMQVYLYTPSIDSLIDAGFVRSYCPRDRRLYVPSNSFLESLMRNKPFTKPDISNLDIHTFLAEYTKLSDERNHDDLDYTLFCHDVYRLIDSNKHLPLCRFLINEIPNNSNWYICAILILRACALIDLYDEFGMSRFECVTLLENSVKQKHVNKIVYNLACFHNGIKVFEPAISESNPLADGNRISLTREFCKHCLKGIDFDRKKLTAEISDGVVLHDNIVAKHLFYNPEEASQIAELGKLLKPRNFTRIQKRLTEHGYRKGFACLFYGTPGTGKTESAMQLAKATGRNIIPVDLSQIRDKFVGESEKRTKAIFDDYRKALRNSKIAPILLLNEADGLLSRRISSIGHSVDQMENTMQNILLQEMEDFEGIMIATTNLTCNLDSAFDRRFLYKIEFHRPSVEARQSIWLSMIDDLRPEDARSMAEEFDFAGGEIENIARKYVVDNILRNSMTDINTLRNICRREKMSRGEERKRIGF